MAKAELKTKATEASVAGFIARIDDPALQRDVLAIDGMMQAATGETGRMWGTAIAGYGKCHLKYASGRELDWMLIGFSPRKQNLTLYIMDGFAKYESLLGRLGKFKTGKSCLYIKKLSDIDTAVLQELMAESVAWMREKWPEVGDVE